MRAIVLFDQSERNIYGCTGTGRCIESAVFDERPSESNLQLRETPCDIGGVTPMSSNFATIEQSSWTQTINSIADRTDAPRLICMRDDPIGNPFTNNSSPDPATTWDHNRVELGRGFERIVWGENDS